MTPLQLIRKYADKDYFNHQKTVIAQLHGFSLRSIIIEHERFKSLLKAIAEIHYYSVKNKVGKAY